MKISTLILILGTAFASTAMVELSGFKTADQLLNDIQSDPKNIYGIIFFKRDDADFDLTKSNKSILDKTKKAADKLAREITDDEIEYLYFARVDASVPENAKLFEKFSFKKEDFDSFPAGAVMKNSGGHKFQGPALTSLFT